MVKNLIDLDKQFDTEEKCRGFLIKQRWDGVPECPYCGYNDKAYIIEGGKRFKCANKLCYKKYSVTVGTIFEASNIPLTIWFKIMYLLTAHKRGVSSAQIARDFGITQKSAWFCLMRIREALKEKGSILLGTKGIVEADETHIGGKIKNKSNKERKAFAEHKNWRINKTMAVGAVERNGDAIMQVMPDYSEDKIKDVIQKNVEFAARVVTDESPAYIGINDSENFYHHTTINHSKKEFARLWFHTNSVEGMFSHFDRMLLGSYFQLSPKHLQRYCDEFIFRYNSRKIKDGERFENAISKISGRLSYKMLVNGKGNKESKAQNTEAPGE